ncbi:Putative esterase [Nakamurella panacisegetis]|uniref:Acyl-CoA:diacylglycerol acyltransferase n=1 Tax=Nakamurella panacisegetis TaxID=1090615 RepID=A0A1H0JQG1_9ACTN|nr:alpha/beta hydrolase-fold protein [Nakamurella panacisegetis]SDO45947.1 Putative esterase [Nakamurella panacisegetis]
MGINRRTFILSGAGAAVVAVGGGAGLVEAGVLPGKARLDAFLSLDGGSGTVPDIASGPIVSGTFRSAARRTTVGYSIVRPPGHTGALPMAVVLHGKSVDHTDAVNGMHYDKFLAAATQSGTPPFALVTVDGGNTTYWHRRASGDDPLTMIRDELLPIAAANGLRTGRIGVTGWSMGGYGALLIGGQLGTRRVAAVAAVSPAIFADYASSSAGSFDSVADFRANDPRNDPGALDGVDVFIDCGTDDPFADQAQQMRSMLHPTPAGGMGRGAHTSAYWTRVTLDQMQFLGRSLAAV